MAWARHNLLPLLALAFMLGIALAANIEAAALPSLAWIGIALSLLVLARLPPDKALIWAVLPLLCCAGFVHARFALDRLEAPGHIGAFLDEKGRGRVTVAGRILDMVESDGVLSRCTLELFWALPLPDDPAVDRPGSPPKLQRISGKAALRVRGRLPETIQPGMQVLALGTAERPKARPGGASWHHAARGIEALLWLKSPEALKPLPGGAPSAFDRIRFGPERLRDRTARFLQTRLPPDIAGVYRALLVGSRQGLGPEAQEWFKACGCMHILAISGLHVGLLAAMTAALLYRLLARSTRILLAGQAKLWAFALTTPILVFYAALAGLNAPVLRALVMALLGLAALFLCRSRAMPHLVAGAALLLLALRPLALCTASFQLSFAAVAAIALVLPRLPWFALTEPGRGDRPARCRAALLSLVLVSVAATIGTLPFMLLHFNRVSLIGPLMNLLVEPLLCLWALPLGLLALACLPWAQPLATLLLHLGGLGIKLALFFLETGSRLPLASVWTITPHPAEMTVYFLVIALALRSGVRARLTAALLACGLAVSFCWSGKNDELRVSYLDVGQGASALVELPGGGRFLIDCGGFFQRDYEVGSRIAAPFLWRRRIRRLDAVLASHADSDHYSGIPFILARFRPKRLYVNTGDKDEPAWREMLARAEAAGIAVVRVAERETMAAGDGFALDCFGAGADADAHDLGENDRSLLARLAYGRRVFLFPGDIASARERLLLRDPQNIRADVLMAGHHGSIGSTSPPFLDAVAPKAIIVSAAASRKGTHPAPEHLARWRERGIAVFSTAESGAIEVRTDGEGLCVRAKGRERCWE